MAVSEAQLSAWSSQGPTISSAATYTSIKSALQQANVLRNYRYLVYLQGSYGNSTNIYGNSDVDVVVELTDAFFSDTSRLPKEQREAYDRQRSTSDRTFEGFRDDVHRGLLAYYGGGLVTARNKCLEVKGQSGRQDADVVPCLSLHRYTQFAPPQQHFDSGIKFFTRKEDIEIVNFPKVHIDNGEAKNKRVGCYKQAIRIFKNWRDRLTKEGYLAPDSTPSYFVECLCWNVPDLAFNQPTWFKTILTCLQFWHGADFATFMCQNNIIPLFGTLPTQWNTDAAYAFRRALIADWNR